MSLEDCLVGAIQVDNRLGLLLSDSTGDAWLYIEEDCYLSTPLGDSILEPGLPMTIVPILHLFNATVAALDISHSGQLQVRFGNGSLLKVGPNRLYEAWQLGWIAGQMLVCSPGGSVVLYREHE